MLKKEKMAKKKNKVSAFKLLGFVLFLGFVHNGEASFVDGGGGIGVGISGGADGAVWIGGGYPNGVPDSAPKQQNSAYDALQIWKSAIKEDPSGVLKTWVGPDVCSYRGVFCSGLSVTAIDLNRANLRGTIVKELALLSDLTILHLNSNRFSGQLPDSFRTLDSLQELDLSNNRFSGPFPFVTIYLPNLVYLDLRFNNFTGPVPEDLFNKRLDAIFLNNNLFDGEIPQNLGNSPASVINLANNRFSGGIPASFGLTGSTLKEILLLNNQLTGCVPESVGLFGEIEVFDVSYNSLMGHVPDTISCLSEIEVLNLAHNKFSGELPDLVCSLRNLMNLTVSFNFFSGFSSDCTKLFFRDVGFDFAGNCIPGGDMQRPPPDCSAIPGGSLSCLRIPAQQLLCGSISVGLKEGNSNYTSSP
ncbi:PREDICTED: leucine-rich repeat extensin-like protein 6 [Tarenaya hassleriana]|uniref:leucine-rich repeat extensin-like protein 6 n=1 Tax=Tarenaya hassleriana TaxID=28532 RepID=UPI00053C400D|nr:PREDICTED: leucine-rich repeat extensin-like protein 6 [Tarenaya hassleriana]